MARSLWRRAVDLARKQSEGRYPLRFDRSAGIRQPTIYFLTPDYQRPSGGIRVIYRHADILCEHGIDAVVLHQRPGFRCRWFANNTRVTHVAAVRIGRGDLLVVPEVRVDVLDRVPRGIRYAIFNQNSHLTWKTPADHVSPYYTRVPELAAVICVSEHNRQMLRCAFPASPIRRLHLGLDPALFHPAAQMPARRIAYMPRRGRDDALPVLAMLKQRCALDGWQVVALDALTHEAVAAELRNGSIYLAFTRHEGFGLPAAEAMACGNYVIGNDGFGGREFFRSDFCAPVEAGDVVGFVEAVGRALRQERANPGWCAQRGRQASEFVLNEYSLSRERMEVHALYAELLAQSPAEASP